MQPLTLEQFNTLCNTATVLTTERGQPKVLELPSSEIIKVFYRRKGWSSSHIWPHAKRFIANSQALQARGISASHIRAAYFCKAKNCHLIIYPKLAGEELRHCLKNQESLLSHFASFLAQLHQQGVFFRGIHLGNVLFSKEQPYFHLIDFADLRVLNKPLSLHKRARNLAHLFKNKEDRSIFESFGLERFLADYWQATGLNSLQKKVVYWLVMKSNRRVD